MRRTYLFRIDKRPSPLCSCGQSLESFLHLILEYPRFSSLRLKYQILNLTSLFTEKTSSPTSCKFNGLRNSFLVISSLITSIHTHSHPSSLVPFSPSPYPRTFLRLKLLLFRLGCYYWRNSAPL